jgi:hypothetical protein
MSGKKKEDYDKLFSFLKSNTQVQNVTLLIDFEQAISRSFNDQFTDSKIFYCLFHFGQAVVRKLNNLV